MKPISPERLYRRILDVINQDSTVIQCPEFIGPDRRRHDEPFAGPDRRHVLPREAATGAHARLAER